MILEMLEDNITLHWCSKKVDDKVINNTGSVDHKELGKLVI